MSVLRDRPDISDEASLAGFFSISLNLFFIKNPIRRHPRRAILVAEPTEKDAEDHKDVSRYVSINC
jgi:hypothetical protein